MVVHRLLMGFPLRKQVPTQNVRPGERAERRSVRRGDGGGEAADRIDRSLSWGRRGAERGWADGKGKDIVRTHEVMFNCA